MWNGKKAKLKLPVSPEAAEAARPGGIRSWRYRLSIARGQCSAGSAYSLSHSRSRN